MDIPNSLSDMDSVPDRIALSREYGAEAVLACALALREDIWLRSVPSLGNAALSASNAIRAFGEVLVASQVAELERMHQDI